MAIEGAFQTVSVDEIARRAGLSRAAYYLHFKSKDDLLTELLEDQLDRFERNFASLSGKRAEARSGVVAWLKEFVQFYAEAQELNALYWLKSNEWRQVHFHARRLSAIRMLGNNVPRLKLFDKEGSIDKRRQIELLLFSYQVEHATSTIASVGEQIDGDSILEELAGKFLELVR